MRLSIIIPTISRPSLWEAIASAANQTRQGDEVIVVGDGPQPWACGVCAQYGAIYHEGPLTRTYGTAQRDYGAQVATGDYLMYLDDDDVYTAHALASVRLALERQPGIPHIFRMDTPWGGVIWTAPVLECGNVGTPMVVAPRDDKLPLWVDGDDPYSGDCRFIKRLVANHAGRVAWQKDVICVVRRL